ncbi:MarR family winged helix-turn-helix transcriptional regulator [Spongisporangium articulatum]|uniref:MarR family winged helix-turn-helix transcriptional regulator n=1 Tax=Spongisporangium articulatum TaxID=3362603 RepID=A0ABW8ANP9_9ACTN
MTDVNRPEPHVFELFDRAMRVLRADLDELMPDFGRKLRTSHLRLLSYIPETGIRVGDLATEAGMTAQAVGEFARDLRAVGLVELAPDPTDRRARLVTLTGEGREVVTATTAAIAAMEARRRADLGEKTWAALRSALSQLGAARG